MKMKFPGADLADYRAQTERQKAMAGVTGPSFRCGECGRSVRIKGRKKTAAGESMMAPMPATVVKVLVEAGQDVAEGAIVLVLEAMKMELPIRAPRDGVVRAVHCTQGELVQPGIALVELE